MHKMILATLLALGAAGNVHAAAQDAIRQVPAVETAPGQVTSLPESATPKPGSAGFVDPQRGGHPFDGKSPKAARG